MVFNFKRYNKNAAINIIEEMHVSKIVCNNAGYFLHINLFYAYVLQRSDGKAMGIDDKKNMVQKNNVIQNLILESRAKLNISGVIDVLNFDDSLVIVQTHLGILTVKGEDLRISKLNTDSEEVIVEGEISTMSYSDKSIDKKESSFLGKIFK